MNPSSRTPEGSPHRCTVCGKSVHIEPSSFPTNDAPCPVCGHLLWFADGSDRGVSLRASNSATGFPYLARHQPGRQLHEYEDQPFAAFERVVWAVIAALSTVVVCLNDGWMLTTGLWLLGIIAFGQLALPRVIRRCDDFLNRSESLYLGVIFGWGLVPGPLVGVLFGVLLPWIYECGLSSFAGGLIGLMVGPCLAVLQGLAIVFMVDVGVWIATGTSLSQRRS